MKLGLKDCVKRILRAGVPVPGIIRPPVRVMYSLGVGVVEGLALVRKLVWVEPVLRSICEEVGKGLRAERLPYIRGRGELRIGSNVNLSGRSCFYFIRGMPRVPRISIGDDTFIGNGCTFSAGQLISVGKHVLISTCVRIHDNDGHPIDPAKRRAGEPIGYGDTAPVVIEDNVWIGADSRIVKGVTIGRNSVIGIGSVVTGDIPPDSLAAGNPARVIRALGSNDIGVAERE